MLPRASETHDLSSCDRLLIGESASEAAISRARNASPTLIGMLPPPSWLAGISAKVNSIVNKEVFPLIAADIGCLDVSQVVGSIGEILGIAYLADYAIENGKPFNIDSASNSVVDIACAVGADERCVRSRLRPLHELYCSEISRMSGACRAMPVFNRYQLKSADVVFCQHLALHILGHSISTGEHYALNAAGAALDVYDDWLDQNEDGKQTGNPFVYCCVNNNGAAHRLFAHLVHPFVNALTIFTSSAQRTLIGDYCNTVLLRLNNSDIYHAIL